MTIRVIEERSARVLDTEEGLFRAVVAWRGRASGRGLLYFVALEGDSPGETSGGGVPDPEDRRDRRAPLEPGRSLEDLSEEGLTERLEAGAPLTATERRFRAPDGRLWLAQSVGPVWADEDPAEGSTGLLFTSLEGPHRRLRAPGGHPGEMEGGELVDLWRRAGSAEGDGDGEGEPAEAPAGGSSPGDGGT